MSTSTPIIEVNISKQIPYNFSNAIQELLKYVPKEDLIGLSKIVIIDEPLDSKWAKQYPWAAGAYFEKFQNRNAYIELYFKKIYSTLPNWFFRFPFLPQHSISYVLFHEIGHHAQKMKHGLGKNVIEKDAGTYAKKYYSDYVRRYNKFRFIWQPLSSIFVRGYWRGQYKSQFKELESKIKQDPKDYASLTKLANLHIKCGYLHVALRLCNRSLKINNQYIDTYWSLISIFKKRKQYKKIEELIEKMAALWPSDEDVKKWEKYIENKFYGSEQALR